MILTAEVVGHRPVVRFAEVPCDHVNLEGNGMRYLEYKPFVFFEISDDLLGSICSILGTYLFFDPYLDAKISKPFEIRRFGSEFFLLASQLARTTVRKFNSEAIYFSESIDRYKNREENDEQLQNDLIETMAYVGCRINEIALRRRCLFIGGI